MALWDSLKSKSADMSAQLKVKAKNFKNADFANASMAMCALIAAADGKIDPAERQKTAGFISTNDVLSIFPPGELREKFDGYCNKLDFDYDFGKIEVMQAVAKLKSKPDQARAVLQVGIIIGGSDGDFDEDEKQAVREACTASGIAPEEFDL